MALTTATEVPGTRVGADFAEVFRTYRADVWRTLRYFGVDERDLEDVGQEVFITVHRQLPGFEGRSSLRVWLYGIARRVAANARRSAARRRTEAIDLAKQVSEETEPDRQIENRQARTELLALL